MKLPDNGMAAAIALMILLVLKATRFVDWSMWIILSPIWIPFLYAFVITVYDEIIRLKKENRR